MSVHLMHFVDEQAMNDTHPGQFPQEPLTRISDSVFGLHAQNLVIPAGATVSDAPELVNSAISSVFH